MNLRKMVSNRFLAAMVLIPFLALISCDKESETEKAIPEKDLHTFEQEFSSSLPYESDESIKLIGYKKIKLTKEDAAEFDKMSSEELNRLNNYYYDKENALLRVYFPVEGALIEHNNSLVEASEVGELALSLNDFENTELAVVGRKQTEDVTGVEGNIIKDGIIYLAQKNKEDHRIGNLLVFDFGEKVIMGHDGHHSEHERVNAEKKSCMRNHGKGKDGKYRNCSTAYGIRNGRCTFRKTVCMDYNGWFTNCKNGKLSNFPGSDCDSALGRGHCWSEVM